MGLTLGCEIQGSLGEPAVGKDGVADKTATWP
jgi:hypothetical protein